MFIRAANSRAGSGYTGDVNTAFRQGRQDAFRDYIDNFNFALQSDVANNAENQRNVLRTAQNYGVNLKMDQGARQDAYNFLKQSADIDNQKIQTAIDFAKNGKLGNQAVINEVASAKATDFVANAQTDAVKQQNNLSDAQFEATQKELKHSTEQLSNQEKFISAQTGIALEQIRQLGVDSQRKVIDVMDGLQDKELLDEFVMRYKEKYPNSGPTDEQIRSYGQNELVRLRQEKAKNIASAEYARMLAASGNFGSPSDTVNFNTPSKQTGKKSTVEAKEPKPVTVKNPGKVTGLSKDEFDKVSGRTVHMGSGVYADGNAVIVDNGRGSLIRYEPNKMSDGTWEPQQELIDRAIQHARGTLPTPSSTINKPIDMNN